MLLIAPSVRTRPGAANRSAPVTAGALPPNPIPPNTGSLGYVTRSSSLHPLCDEDIPMLSFNTQHPFDLRSEVVRACVRPPHNMHACMHVADPTECSVVCTASELSSDVCIQETLTRPIWLTWWPALQAL